MYSGTWYAADFNYLISLSRCSCWAYSSETYYLACLQTSTSIFFILTIALIKDKRRKYFQGRGVGKIVECYRENIFVYTHLKIVMISLRYSIV